MSDISGRDMRFLRASQKVLKKYKISISKEDKNIIDFIITGGNKPYEVRIDKSGIIKPKCSCPDAKKWNNEKDGLCKHAIAILQTKKQYRFQLLDLFL